MAAVSPEITLTIARQGGAEQCRQVLDNRNYSQRTGKTTTEESVDGYHEGLQLTIIFIIDDLIISFCFIKCPKTVDSYPHNFPESKVMSFRLSVC